MRHEIMVHTLSRSASGMVAVDLQRPVRAGLGPAAHFDGNHRLFAGLVGLGGAGLGALFINSQVLLAMSLAFAQGNVLGTATITYGSLAVIFCGPAIWSAALDCGNEIAIWRGNNGD